VATVQVDLRFAQTVATSGEFNAWACMNCGVCSACCPMGIELLPRQLFRQVVLGLRSEVLEQADVIFQCLLCRACEQNCPAGVHITENIRFLRGYIDREVFGLDRRYRLALSSRVVVVEEEEEYAAADG
jgi:heterodisulfide reductase subunit C